VPDTLLTQQEQLTLHVIDGACKWDMVSDEQRLLHSLGKSQGVLFNDIRVYYVNKIRTPSGNLEAVWLKWIVAKMIQTEGIFSRFRGE